MENKFGKNLDSKFLMVMFVIACFTFLAALNKINSKDYQTTVTGILAIYAGAKALFNRKK